MGTFVRCGFRYSIHVFNRGASFNLQALIFPQTITMVLLHCRRDLQSVSTRRYCSVKSGGGGY